MAADKRVMIHCTGCHDRFLASESNVGLYHSCDNQLGGRGLMEQQKRCTKHSWKLADVFYRTVHPIAKIEGFRCVKCGERDYRETRIKREQVPY